MDKAPKGFLFLILLITLIVVFYRYQQYVVDKNFILNVNTVCDPNIENCFTADCLPGTDSECDTTPYKKVKILDRYAPKCLEEHNCSSFSCEKYNSNCYVTYCSPDTLENGEKCLESINK